MQNITNDIVVEDFIDGLKEGFFEGFAEGLSIFAEGPAPKSNEGLELGRSESHKEVYLELALAFINDGWTDIPKLLKFCKITDKELTTALEARKKQLIIILQN